MRRIKYKVARNDLSRIYLRDSKSCCSYQLTDLMSVADATQSRGDLQKIQASDPNAFGKFVTVDVIPGELERMTSSLTITMLTDRPNGLYDFMYKSKPIDFQVHFGECSNPQNFNEFDKALIFEDVYATNWSATSLVAASASEKSAVTETVEVSIGKFYEVYQMYLKNMDSYFTNVANGAFISSALQCVEDCNSSGIGDYGTTNIFLLQIAFENVYCDNTTSNVSTPKLVLWYSWDGGETFNTKDIDMIEYITSSTPATCAENIDIRSAHITVYNNMLYLSAGLGHSGIFDLGELFYNDQLRLKYYSGILGEFNWIIYDQIVLNNYLFVVGEDAKLWKLNNTFSKNERIFVDTNAAYSTPFYSIHGIDENTFIAGHDLGVFKYKNGQMTLIPDSPEGVTNVWMLSDSHYLASTTRAIFTSCNGGITWETAYTILNDECIMNYKFVTNQVGFMITNSPTLGPRVYRSVDMGCTWNLLEQNALTQYYNFTTLAVCPNNTNLFIVAGLFATNSVLNIYCELESAYTNAVNTYDGTLHFGKVANSEYKLSM